MDLDDILHAAPVIPVIVIERAENARPLAEALGRGGLPVLEITLRTPAALDALRVMAAQRGLVVGAGTVLDAQQAEAAVAAGARFLVSPGLSDAVQDAAARLGVPLLPGVATATEMMRARASGFTRLKFFPAEAAGGVAALKAYASVFPDLRFCPTGGITSTLAPDYLALPNVACIGGSWLLPPEAVAAGDWGRIERLAQAAAALKRAG